MALTVAVEGQKFPLVVTTSPQTSQTLPVGTVAYWQNGVFGTPLGLLLALTFTPQIRKVIQTASNGLRMIS